MKTTRVVTDRPLFDSRVYGGVTVVRWIKRAGRGGDVVVFGTDIGYLLLWGRRSEFSVRNLNLLNLTHDSRHA